ncbi:hypothetical protein ES319_D01G119500v1 [Gossypium barbadense]|uniref:C3H1-type domain-containing protein n=2 Tax=Gossypium TaxID=3633 RepID=A0A5J5SNA8_GOSBA|nr:hypothetical protein ES319_D01G119500v1 [Gossypium barbadense]TYG82961.1 hypothetical protein ES288_D01G130900v1 [Gossypium darwinii]
MRGLHKSKRVTWAPDVNLCQIRLFLSEESPLQVGLGAQDHLQAKTSSISHLNGATVDDFLPPGFEGSRSTDQMQINLTEILVVKWRCPLRFVLDLNWQVVAGEESKEADVQNQRELRVLEAVYPRPSAIPTNPSVSADMANCQYDDKQTPQIPITPIEDEDAAIGTQSNVLAPFGAPTSLQPQLLDILPHLNCSMPSISSVPTNEKPTAAAFTATNQSNENGNMIDPDLLVQILSNPKLIEKLVTEHGVASGHIGRTENDGAFYGKSNGVGIGASNKHGSVPGVCPISHSLAMELPQKKDVNYYKNLIQQHGGESQVGGQKFNNRYNQQLRPNQEVINNPRSRDSKPRIMKPCIYFNNSRGCRNGANCAYQHDTSSQNRGNSIPDAPTAKRMKMDREIGS